MKTGSLYLAALVLVLSTLLQGCAFLVGAAAGGAAGYMLKDNGYEVQSPVTRDGS